MLNPSPAQEVNMPSLDQILAVILGGGRGARLYPLTQQRSKPAVPIAGKYRLIDIPISNCINSGIFRIAVLTQFNSVSLIRHISRTYNFDTFHTGWVQVWAAEQTITSNDWYQGTADAVRKQLFEIKAARAPYVLILAGDHLYRMDYAAMARFHWEKDADVTVAVQPVARQNASRLGILKRNSGFRITDFAEKPKDLARQEELISRPDPEMPYLGSMGIYLFKTDVLEHILTSYEFDDFGNHVLPHAISNHNVYGYDFEGFWEDVGTMRSFYDANLALTMPNPAFNLFDAERPVYTHPRWLPASTVENSLLTNVMIAEGCCVMDAEIRHSIVGVRSQIRHGAKIIDSILMGADYYDASQCSDNELLPDGNVPIGIGSGSEILGAIIDKNARIGRNVIIRPFPRGTDLDGANWAVRDGIVVIPKGAVLPTGTTIKP
jgi:glucose-1-phosphate adenylyltransferase